MNYLVEGVKGIRDNSKIIYVINDIYAEPDKHFQPFCWFILICAIKVMFLILSHSIISFPRILLVGISIFLNGIVYDEFRRDSSIVYIKINDRLWIHKQLILIVSCMIIISFPPEITIPGLKVFLFITYFISNIVMSMFLNDAINKNTQLIKQYVRSKIPDLPGSFYRNTAENIWSIIYYTNRCLFTMVVVKLCPFNLGGFVKIILNSILLSVTAYEYSHGSITANKLVKTNVIYCIGFGLPYIIVIYLISNGFYAEEFLMSIAIPVLNTISCYITPPTNPNIPKVASLFYVPDVFSSFVIKKFIKIR